MHCNKYYDFGWGPAFRSFTVDVFELFFFPAYKGSRLSKNIFVDGTAQRNVLEDRG